MLQAKLNVSLLKVMVFDGRRKKREWNQERMKTKAKKKEKEGKMVKEHEQEEE